MADWEEIKRLAADFQRTQTSDTLQRISDRNCIDIINKLTELNLIELIYTCDGKEFITPAHLIKEIEDEIYVNGGRMHLHDLATNLNVDYQHVESKSKQLAGDKPDEYSVILGQVIHSTYKITLSKQISDCMLTTGQLSIADFAKSLDLPSEFLLKIVKEILPTVIEDYVVSQDERTYYTTDMMDNYKSIITGTLSAITKPTSISTLMKRLEIPERIFLPIVEGLLKEGRIDASIENRVFVPAIYAREQSEWIGKFYSANSYIEYDVLSRMDIKQPKALLKKRFPDGIALKTCFISPDLLSQVESLIEDCIDANGWIDISTIIPSAIESDDIEQMLQDVFKKNKLFSTSCLIFDQTCVCSLGYVANSKSSLQSLMPKKAQEHLEQGDLVKYFIGTKVREPVKKQQIPDESEKVQVEIKSKDNDDKKAIDINDEDEPEGKGGRKDRKDKKGKGDGGREVKQKAVKKKYIPGNKGSATNDDEPGPTKGPRSNKGRAARRAMSPERPDIAPPEKEPLIFMTLEEIVKRLKVESRGSEEASDEFYESVAKMILDDLNKSYEVLAKQTLDEYLKSKEEEEEEATDPNKVEDVISSYDVIKDDNQVDHDMPS